MATKTPNQNRIVLENFNTMTPWARTYTPKTQFSRIVSNLLQTDYLSDGDNRQRAALVPSFGPDSYYALATGNYSDGSNVQKMIADQTQATDFYALSNHGAVYRVTKSLGSTGLISRPSSNIIWSNALAGADIACFNGELFESSPLYTGGIVYWDGNNGTAWNTSYVGVQALGINSLLPYSSYLYVGGTSDNRIYRWSSSGTQVYPGNGIGGLLLPSWLGTVMLENYNNKYIAIGAAPQIASASSPIGNYLFLWDGVSASYNYAIEAPGQIVGMKTIGGYLWIAISFSSPSAGGEWTSSALYVLSGITLKKVFQMPGITMECFDSNGNVINKNCLFDILGNVGLLTRKGKLVYDFSQKMLYDFYDDWSGSSMITAFGVNGTAVKFFFVTSSTVYQLYYGIVGGSLTAQYSAPYMATNWIDAIGQLSSIELYYDSPPPSTNSYFYVDVYYEDENYSGTQSKVHLAQIDSSNCLNNKYTLIDGAGINFRRLQVVVGGYAAPADNWMLIIRKVVINYEPSIIL